MSVLTFAKIISSEEPPNEKIAKDVKILLSTFCARALFALYSVRIGYFEFWCKKTKRRVIKCHVTNKVTYLFSARRNRKGAVLDEGFSANFPMFVCLLLYFPSYQSASYRFMSTQNQCFDPPNYVLFPDQELFLRSLYDHLIHDGHHECDKVVPTSET